MLKVFGKNTNSLFKNSSKQTYSMPQTIKNAPMPVRKLSCGYDFMVMIGTRQNKKNSLFFLYQNNFYPITSGLDQIFDLAVSEHTIAVITLAGEIYVWEFDEEKTKKGIVSANHIKIQLDSEDSLMGIYVGGNDIFLNTQEGRVLHFKRNQWYETKTYSNTESLELSSKIVHISPGPHSNLFLTYDGKIFESTKEDPLTLTHIKSKETFISIASYGYHAAISKRGTIYIWGDSIHGKYTQPTQFAKLTKKFLGIWLEKDNAFALSDDGQIWGWGCNKNGELGLSDYEQRLKPFPLVTLDKYKCLDIFCGESYTVCLCESHQKNEGRQVKVVNRRISGFQIQRNQSKQSLATFIRKEDFEYDEKLYNFHSSCAVLKSPKTPKNKSKDKKPSVSKSKPKNSTKLSAMLTPKNSRPPRSSSISPKKSHSKQKKTSDKKVSIIQNNFTLNHVPESEESFKDEINVVYQRQNEELKSVNLSLRDENNNLQEEINKVCEENDNMKVQIRDQKQLIEDITQKIRLLEEAIDEYQKDLTARDNIVGEYHEKQKSYIAHIEELQKSIDDLIHQKERNKQITVIYQDMEKNFEKERNYYTDKIKDMETMLYHEKNSNENRIDYLKRELEKNAQSKENQADESTIQKKSSQKLKDILNRQIEEKGWSTPSPILKVRNIDSIPYFSNHASFNCENKPKDTTPEHTDTEEMQKMIERIQSSKSRIRESANKLFSVLDKSN